MSDRPKSSWVHIVDHLADSVLDETLEELASDLDPGQSVAEAAASFRKELLAAFDGADVGTGDCSSSAAVTDARPTNLVLLIRKRSGRQLTEVAKAIPNTSMEFLTLVSRFPDLIPPQVKSKLSEELEVRFEIPSADSQTALKRRPPVAMAASSRRTPGPDPTDFQELLDRSNLNASQRKFWLSLE